jgi:hypothetical protein
MLQHSFVDRVAVRYAVLDKVRLEDSRSQTRIASMADGPREVFLRPARIKERNANQESHLFWQMGS